MKRHRQDTISIFQENNTNAFKIHLFSFWNTNKMGKKFNLANVICNVESPSWNLKIKQQCKSSDNQYRFKFRNIISDDEVFGAQPKIHNETFLQK